MTGYVHSCPTVTEFGKCRCFDDVVNSVAGNGDWYYWHDGVYTRGAGKATGEMLGRPVVDGEIGKAADGVAAALGEGT